ncbi:DsbA family oxidoreductase [Ramlibacter sp. AW1]|uniref:DsbA family oxidoreductase n=1 Tax=Ramlibacter aurantiacus TaxID=2801330 RepID=A0A936ZN97_9BURK|nr:DsbA family oxidoreductase [Ramlibacter aurantiacus]MBL0420438.1 DsbA family oxidoreductase [Ramlibacter aurantiacus]
MSASHTLSIDFVSDVACPWCAVGLASLEQAIVRLQGDMSVELRFQPFELNPQMGPQGQDLTEHLAQKYGSTPEQQAANWEALRQRAAAVGFDFRKEGRGRMWNTFNAHRLLHWAGLQDASRQHALKKALLTAYFTRGESPADTDVLLAAVREAGLEVERAREILAGDDYAQEVRERERFYTSAGIHAVPSVIVNERHLIQGGQPPEVFEQALRQIAAH